MYNSSSLFLINQGLLTLFHSALRNSWINMDSIKCTLQDLLDDLGWFLGETLVGESLSSRVEVQRAGLLQRLEPHIRRSVANIMSVPKMTPQHIEMKSVNGSNVEEDYEEPLAAVASESAFSSSNSRKLEDSFKFNLPFNKLRNITVKCGPLWRREKVIFLDQWRKCWTGLHGHFLLMYCSEHDVKPYVYVNVQGFVARPAPNYIKDPKKKDATFEIVCPGKRDYQFIARTAKDMHQWVAAICQESIQYIQTSILPLPHRTLDKSVLRSAKDVPAPADSDSETYDDVSSVIKCDGERETIYELGQTYEEEFYHDIPDAYQRNSGLESKPDVEVKSVEKCPPLPLRRPVPSAPQDDLSDQDSVYDDVGNLNQCNGYSNMADTGVGRIHTGVQPGVSAVGAKELHTEVQPDAEEEQTAVQPGISVGAEVRQGEIQPGVSVVGAKKRHTEIQPSIGVRHTKAQSQQSVKLEVEYDDEEEEEEIYDEIGVTEELPKATKPPVLQQRSFVGDGGGIQNLIKQLKLSLPKGNIPIGGHHPDYKMPNQIEPNTSTLYKSVKNSGEDRISQTTTANHNPKYKPNTSNLHNTMKTTEENITFSSPGTPQPPALPPRSYLKR